MKPGLLLSALPALLCLVAGSAAAQSQVMADKVAAVVGNSMILYSDLVQTSKSLIRAAPPTGVYVGPRSVVRSARDADRAENSL
ncbi:MAG: hypothetical protein ACLTZY_11635 [Alistipes indistinctus]